MGIREKRLSYKPFEYPEFYNEGWFKQQQAHWLHTEISMGIDVSDWKLTLTEVEKNIVGKILLGFAQTECLVGDYWSVKVPKWFPKPEIEHMAVAFASFEGIHAAAYSYLNDTLGLEDYEAFLEDEATMGKLGQLISVGKETGGDVHNRDVARSLAVFSAFAEGVSLYSSFAILLSFQMRDLLKGIGQQMKYSVRDESLHSRMGCQLFNTLCAENPGLREQVAESIYEAARLTIDNEFFFIDQVFAMGDLKNLTAADLKNFIANRANEKLIELGLNPLFEDINEDGLIRMEWFGHLTGGNMSTDFFAHKVTDYSKAGEDQDWNDIFKK
jgi:ribonucleoside-diphosphate reductase beta chain